MPHVILAACHVKGRFLPSDKCKVSWGWAMECGGVNDSGVGSLT